LSEFACGVVGHISGFGEEGIEHQLTTRDQAVGGESEDGAQSAGRPEVGHHLGKQDQPIVPPQVFVAGEDVPLDHANVE
jgi:hypothetical protein